MCSFEVRGSGEQKESTGLRLHKAPDLPIILFQFGAVSSVVEHYLDTVGVTGSNPVSRTIFFTRKDKNVPEITVNPDSIGCGFATDSFRPVMGSICQSDNQRRVATGRGNVNVVDGWTVGAVKGGSGPGPLCMRIGGHRSHQTQTTGYVGKASARRVSAARYPG